MKVGRIFRQVTQCRAHCFDSPANAGPQIWTRQLSITTMSCVGASEPSSFRHRRGTGHGTFDHHRGDHVTQIASADRLPSFQAERRQSRRLAWLAHQSHHVRADGGLDKHQPGTIKHTLRFGTFALSARCRSPPAAAFWKRDVVSVEKTPERAGRLVLIRRFGRGYQGQVRPLGEIRSKSTTAKCAATATDLRGAFADTYRSRPYRRRHADLATPRRTGLHSCDNALPQESRPSACQPP